MAILARCSHCGEPFERLVKFCPNCGLSLAGGEFTDKSGVAVRDLAREFGTTLHGLQREAQVDPADYSRFVHDIDHASLLAPHPELGAMLARIPLNKVGSS